jgi:heme-degrading monooxygenase HmoA
VFARMTVLEGPPESIDPALQNLQESVIPWGRQTKGFSGFLALADRSTGKTIGISFWDSEDSMRASEEGATAQRQGVAQAANEQIASIERFEVLLDERG